MDIRAPHLIAENTVLPLLSTKYVDISYELVFTPFGGDRNCKVFQNKTTPTAVIVERVFRLVEEQGNYSTQIYGVMGLRPPTSPNKWSAPLASLIKLNADACLAVDGWVGLGAVARDSEGRVLATATRRSHAYWMPEVAEAKALLFALKLAKRYGFREIILESDCKVIIDRLSKAPLSLEIDIVLGDILNLCSHFLSVGLM